MTWFVVIAVVMTAMALAWLLPPLLRRRALSDGVARSSSNLAILRDQLAELDADLAHGTLTPEQHASARNELERRVLEEGEGEPGSAGSTPAGGRWVAAAVAALVPLSALLIYLITGSPEALAPGRTHGDAGMTPEQVEQMVSRLAQRLEANPEDGRGWALLGRSYYAMGRFDEAVKAYARAVKQVTDDASLYADYADALAMSQGRSIDAEALALINQALKIDPDHMKALVLAGSAAFERKDYKAALAYMERVQRQLPPDAPVARMVAERVEEARMRAAGKPEAPAAAPAATAAATIKGRASLSPALAGKAAATDTVFILARAPEGPRMPLAILKRQVKDLPLEFTLSDEQAMTPEMRLSKFREVVIVVRVSKAGGAAPQSGDLEGASGKVKVGATGVNVVVDGVIP